METLITVLLNLALMLAALLSAQLAVVWGELGSSELGDPMAQSPLRNSVKLSHRMCGHLFQGRCGVDRVNLRRGGCAALGTFALQSSACYG